MQEAGRKNESFVAFVKWQLIGMTLAWHCIISPTTNMRDRIPTCSANINYILTGEKTKIIYFERWLEDAMTMNRQNIITRPQSGARIIILNTGLALSPSNPGRNWRSVSGRFQEARKYSWSYWELLRSPHSHETCQNVWPPPTRPWCRSLSWPWRSQVSLLTITTEEHLTRRTLDFYPPSLMCVT